MMLLISALLTAVCYGVAFGYMTIRHDLPMWVFLVIFVGMLFAVMTGHAIAEENPHDE